MNRRALSRSVAKKREETTKKEREGEKRKEKEKPAEAEAQGVIVRDF